MLTYFCDLVIIAHAIVDKALKLCMRNSEVRNSYKLMKAIRKESNGKLSIVEEL